MSAEVDGDLAAMLEANWGAVTEEQPVHTEALSFLTEEAEKCQVSSDCPSCDAVEVEQSVRLKPSSPWWAFRLVHLTKTHEHPGYPRPLNIISGCTGISAESFVCEAPQSNARLSTVKRTVVMAFH